MTDSASITRVRAEAQILLEAATSDQAGNRWANWPDYLREFNSLNEQAINAGVDTGIQAIDTVPPGRLPAMGGIGAGTHGEVAKVGEIIMATKKLLARLESGALPAVVPANAAGSVERICRRFHLVATQLQQRHARRGTLTIQDEYDVQDLLHALLRISFDDVRAEEWTPSYSGKSSRMDFLLKPERIVIEAKKTRVGLGEKQLGDELIVDVERYRKSADCDTLACLVYDPDGRVKNPRGVESDISGERDGISVVVFIVP